MEAWFAPVGNIGFQPVQKAPQKLRDDYLPGTRNRSVFRPTPSLLVGLHIKNDFVSEVVDRLEAWPTIRQIPDWH